MREEYEEKGPLKLKWKQVTCTILRNKWDLPFAKPLGKSSRGEGERREKDTEEKKAKTERKEEVLCLSSQTAVGFRDIFQEESI